MNLCRRLQILAAAALALAVIAWPAAAEAGQLKLIDGVVVFSAKPEPDFSLDGRVTASGLFEGSLYFTDVAYLPRNRERDNRISGYAGCESNDEGTTATCPSLGVRGLEFLQGSGDDTLDVNTTTLPIQATGGTGDDILATWDGKDRLSGGFGNDNLIGREGRDVYSGGSGNDEIVAAQTNEFTRAGVDRVNCGTGDDEVFADSGDNIDDNCEDITILRP